MSRDVIVATERLFADALARSDWPSRPTALAPYWLDLDQDAALFRHVRLVLRRPGGRGGAAYLYAIAAAAQARVLYDGGISQGVKAKLDLTLPDIAPLSTVAGGPEAFSADEAGPCILLETNCGAVLQVFGRGILVVPPDLHIMAEKRASSAAVLQHMARTSVRLATIMGLGSFSVRGLAAGPGGPGEVVTFIERVLTRYDLLTGAPAIEAEPDAPSRRIGARRPAPLPAHLAHSSPEERGRLRRLLRAEAWDTETAGMVGRLYGAPPLWTPASATEDGFPQPHETLTPAMDFCTSSRSLAVEEADPSPVDELLLGRIPTPTKFTIRRAARPG